VEASDEAKPRRAEDRLAFLKGLAGNPRRIGAVAPSGPALSRLMASFVDPDDDKPILELGPGTGVVTAALIKRGVAPERIVAVEFNPDFCALLRERFAGITVVEGDAYDLKATLPADKAGPFSAVVSGLPLLTRPPDVRRDLIWQALDRMAPDAPFVQFSYSLLLPPVKPVAGRFTVKPSKWVVMNLPPARVWVYRRLG
jgi:phosphatidylethanolamine/phosphatidyl-N-methylethanolamine N-methyltransferase